MDDLPIDPSFGSHFFQNITSLYVAYLTVNPKSKKDQLLLDWIDEDFLVQSNKYTSWYRFKNPFVMTLNPSISWSPEYRNSFKFRIMAPRKTFARRNIRQFLDETNERANERTNKQTNERFWHFFRFLAACYAPPPKIEKNA